MFKDFIRKNRTGIGLAAAVLIVSAALSVSLFAFSAEATEKEQEKNLRFVETSELKYAPYTIRVEVQGFIKPERTLTLSSAVSGQVTETYRDLKSGIEAAEGTLLVRLDDETVANSLALARSGLISSTARLLAVFKSEDSGLYESWQSYLKQLNTTGGRVPVLPGISSEREKLLVSTYGVLEAYYSVRELEESLNHYRITAPFSGYISGDGVPRYSYVSPGQDLLTLTDSRNLEISLPLTREEIILLGDIQTEVIISPAGSDSALQAGAESGADAGRGADTGADAGRGAAAGAATILTGRVERIDRVMDRSSQTIDIHISFENPDLNPLFFPGNYGSVRISGRTLERTLTLPRSLLNPDFTINIYESGRLKKYPVEVLVSRKDSVILAPTLPEGVQIITTRIQKPFEGMELKLAGGAL
ncbi:MAG: hypothetical protein PQJ50_13055 [Spirochaetales bacterium]|nr:hypothetical protein [Spirochaetales bacterium]